MKRLKIKTKTFYLVLMVSFTMLKNKYYVVQIQLECKKYDMKFYFFNISEFGNIFFFLTKKVIKIKLHKYGEDQKSSFKINSSKIKTKTHFNQNTVYLRI